MKSCHYPGILIYSFHFLWTAFVVVCCAVSPLQAQESASRVVEQQQFFQTLNDVPLMPGLYEMLDESVVFDKPEGRIIESSAAVEAVTEQEIHRFYAQTLPQLGWNQVGADTFIRQGESLTLNIESRGNYNVVRFMVSPR